MGAAKKGGKYKGYADGGKVKKSYKKEKAAYESMKKEESDAATFKRMGGEKFREMRKNQMLKKTAVKKKVETKKKGLFGGYKTRQEQIDAQLKKASVK